MITISVTNQKGGVAKTTTALNLAVGLARSGYQVLAVDLDPQANLTIGFGVNSSKVPVEKTVACLFRDGDIGEVLVPTSEPNLKILPSNIELAEESENFSSVLWREEKLANGLSTVKDRFDYAVLDCPPNLGVLSVNGIVAASNILVPTKLEFWSVDGLNSLLRTITKVRKGKSDYDLRILRTVVNSRREMEEEEAWQVLSPLAGRILETQIRDTVGVVRSQSPKKGEVKLMAVVTQPPSANPASRDYWSLVKEIAQIWPVSSKK